MLPSLKTVKAGLHRTTEALAAELAAARPGSSTPNWTALEWRLACAVAVAHGVSPLLASFCAWDQTDWRLFVQQQRDHVEQRHRRIADLLQRIDASARADDLAVVALKGSALHALGLYAAGDRPMADVDLLVREDDVPRTRRLLESLGYVESFVQWKHRVYKPAEGTPTAGLGEHRDTPINIELHTRIHERLPISTVDVTERVYPSAPVAGINPYPSNGALMSHLLLHAAGNMCGRSLRLLHLNDISLLAARMQPGDWDVLWQSDTPWWALPPLRLVARYYRDAVPAHVMARLEKSCPMPLRLFARRQTLTTVSCSELWLHALPGIEWARTPGEAALCIRNRLRPTREAIQERDDMIRTQFWLQGQSWVRLGHGRRILRWLTQPVPRMDTLYVVRAALGEG
ncbi:nucleotidyltransferase family protein [Dyella sp.]|uniref:nucleotidyltransferase family protein n=1 Tax=Dyella sp. TaxID=1869338 RepID=UPI002ED24D89